MVANGWVSDEMLKLTWPVRVSGEVGALYNMVGQSDSAPTAAQLKAAATVAQEVPVVINQWNQFKASELGPLNQRLKAAGLQPIEPNIKTEEEVSGFDEE